MVDQKTMGLAVIIVSLLGFFVFQMIADNTSTYDEFAQIEFKISGNPEGNYTIQIPVVMNDSEITPSMRKMQIKQQLPVTSQISIVLISGDAYSYIEITGNAAFFVIYGSFSLPDHRGSRIYYEPQVFSHTIYAENVTRQKEPVLDQIGIPIFLFAENGTQGTLSYLFEAETNLCGMSSRDNIFRDLVIEPGINYSYDYDLAAWCY